MKKILLALGTIAAVAAPVAAVVACGASTTKTITIDFTDAKDGKDLNAKVQEVSKQMQKEESGDDVSTLHLKLVDGDRSLELSFEEGASNAEMQKEAAKLMPFFIASYTQRNATMPLTGALAGI